MNRGYPIDLTDNQWQILQKKSVTNDKKGRKDQVVVDTMGFPMAVSVHKASIHDSKGAESTIMA